MIVKCLSRKSNVDQLIKYVLQDCKMNPAKQEKTLKPIHVRGVHLTETDIKYLYAEGADSAFLREFKESELNGNSKEFIAKYVADNVRTVGNEVDTFSGVLIKHNLRSRSIPGFIKAFKENEDLRKHVRSNNVKAYHHIISFSGLDKDKIDEAILKDIAQKYISLRGESSLYVGAVHRDKEHTHIHIVQSGTQYGTGLANRVSKQEFQEMKIQLQEYQKEKYPELVNSTPNHGVGNSKTKRMATEKNINANERNGDKKMALAAFLLSSFAKSTSKEEFLSDITKNGHEPYYRNGKLQGVKYNGEQKFRFTSLGIRQIMDDVNQKIDREKMELQEIEQLRSGRKERALETNRQTKRPYEETVKGKTDDEIRSVQQDMLNQSRDFEKEHGIDTSSNPKQDDVHERTSESEERSQDEEFEIDK